MTIFTTFWVKTRKPRSKDFESLELKLNSFDSRSSIENQPEYVPLIYKVWTSQVKNSVCVQSGWFLFFAWFYHSKNSGSRFWHWAENSKEQPAQEKRDQSFLVSRVVMFRPFTRIFSCRPPQTSDLNITPRFAKTLDF